jgi:hypothetical protein
MMPRPRGKRHGPGRPDAASSALFARKLDERVDRDPLVQLARDCGYAVPRAAPAPVAEA